MDNLSYFVSCFPQRISILVNSLDSEIKNSITEFRIRKNKHLIIYIRTKCYFLEPCGSITTKPTNSAIVINEDEFNQICDKLCNNSYHTNMSSMTQGYITVKNGSRIGVASSAVYKNDILYSVKDITSLNIRISHDVLGSARPILKKLSDKPCSIIIASPPGLGKTTFLRDYSRLISNGYYGDYQKICIVDERRELAANFDVGINTDVLVGFPKKLGIEIATRTLSPDMIICDEIGNMDECEAIRSSFSNGIKFAVSVHLKNKREIFTNDIVSTLIKIKKFDYLIVLKNYTYDFEIINLSEKEFETCWNINA